MKKFLLATTIVGLTALSGSAMAADPTAPADPFGINLDLWGGYYFLGGSSGNADDTVDKSMFSYGGDATMVFGLGSDVMLQLGLQAGDMLVNNADDDQNSGGGQISSHLTHSSGLGLFGGVGKVYYPSDTDRSNGLWFIGAEYVHQFDSGDVLLQAGYFDVTDTTPSESLRDAWFANLAPSFDLSDDVTLGAHAGYAHGDVNESDSGSVYSWGASLDYAMAPSWSLFLAYDGMLLDSTVGNADEHLVKAGVTFSTGGMADDEIATPEVWRWVGIGQRSD